jgi:hypothetical protein
VAFVLHHTRIGKGAMKNSASIPNGAVNFFDTIFLLSTGKAEMNALRLWKLCGRNSVCCGLGIRNKTPRHLLFITM